DEDAGPALAFRIARHGQRLHILRRQRRQELDAVLVKANPPGTSPRMLFIECVRSRTCVTR
ncbi:hypothetical protein, partial [Corallococcus llansteffanensis]